MQTKTIKFNEIIVLSLLNNPLIGKTVKLTVLEDGTVTTDFKVGKKKHSVVEEKPGMYRLYITDDPCPGLKTAAQMIERINEHSEYLFKHNI